MYEESYNTIKITPALWLWGKAATDDDGSIIAMQPPLICKDYIVDTYYKSTQGYRYTNWTDDQRYENCIYVSFPSEEIFLCFVHNLSNFLNPWFAANDIAPTTIEIFSKTCFQLLKGQHIYCIRGDSKWMINAFSWSIYLSIIRLIGHQKEMTQINFDKDQSLCLCNELVYFNNYDFESKEREILMDIFTNPFPYLIEMELPYKKTGYKTYIPGHGQTGPFYLLSCCTCATNKRQDFTIFCKEYYFGDIIYKKLYNKAYKYVRKM